MTLSLKKYYPSYPAYQDSGVAWIGKIPEGWKTKKMKYIGQISLGKMLQNENTGTDHLRPYLRAQNILWERVDVSDVRDMWFSPDELQKHRIRKNDLLVSEGGEVGRTALWDESVKECFVQNSINRISLFKDHEAKYVLYQFEAFGKGKIFESIVNQVSIAHLTRDKLKEISFILPEHNVQQAIASYLDSKTALIDQIITRKHRLIELLQEKRAAIINQAVTRGLNTAVEMKLINVAWLEEIPKRWSVQKLKHVAKAIVGFAFNSDDYIHDGIPLIRIGNIRPDGTIAIEDAKRLPLHYLDTYRFVRVDRGALLMAMTGATIGKVGKYLFEQPGLLNQRVCKFLPVSIDERYLRYILKSDRYFEYIKLIGFGGAQPNISDAQLLDYFVAIPPLTEQQEIASNLDSKTALIDQAIQKIEDSIACLTEFRSSLISHVVTGKVKVA